VALSLHTGHPLRRLPASQRLMHNPLSHAYRTSGDGILTDLLGYDWDAVIDLKVKGAVG
jgi:hypothetical protein